VWLQAAHGGVAEALRQYAALPGVQGLGYGGVGRPGALLCGKGRVELGLLHVGFEAVDGLHGGVGVEGDAVWPIAHDGPIALVQGVEVQMALAAPGVVDGVPIGETTEEGPRVGGERVEEEAVDGEEEELLLSVTVRILLGSLVDAYIADTCNCYEGGQLEQHACD
jgi:hypothetical protein